MENSDSGSGANEMDKLCRRGFEAGVLPELPLIGTGDHALPIRNPHAKCKCQVNKGLVSNKHKRPMDAGIRIQISVESDFGIGYTVA
jgi:hypothetical protein